MRRLSVSLGVLVLVDVLRGFLPAVVAAVGMGARTPGPVLAGVVVAWLVLPVVAVRAGAGWAAAAGAAVALGAGRVGLQLAGGGSGRLVVGAAAVVAGLVWLGTVAGRGRRDDYAGLVLGLAASAVAHGALGTVDLAARDGAAAAAAVVLVAGLFVGTALLPASLADGTPGTAAGGGAAAGRVGTGPTGGGPGAGGPTGGGPGAGGAAAGGPGAGGAVAGGPAGDGGGPGARVWWVAQPVMVLWGALGGSAAVVGAGVSALGGAGGVAAPAGVPAPVGTVLVKVLVAAAVAAFTGAALGRPAPRAAGLALVAGTALGVAAGPRLLPVAVLLVAAGLGGCLAAAAGGPPGTARGRGYGLAAGGILAAVVTVAYYGAYDAGVENRPVPVLLAAGIAAVAVGARPTPTSRPAGAAAGRRGRQVDVVAAVRRAGTRGRPAGAGTGRVAVAGAGAGRVAVVVGVVALAVVDGGRWGPVPPADPGERLRVVAYNVHGGVGLDGRVDPAGVAALLAGQRPDVVVLTEVDRGWWVTGGRDGLAALADRLGMTALYAPAAGALWGDAVLTRLPVVSARTVTLPAEGGRTAQALGTVLRLGDREVGVVGTHLRPAPGRGPVAQARALAAVAAELGTGRPVVVAGDLNTEPGDPAYQVLVDAGLTDALAAARPLPTAPAGAPRAQLDHVLVSPGVGAADAAAPPSPLSDHVPVVVTLTP